MRKKITYSDFSLDFTAHPVTGDISKLINDNAIKNSIELLLDMEYFNAPMQPEKGSPIKRILFEPMGIDSVIELKDAIEEVILKYEPRVRLEEVRVKADYDNAIYNVEIIFQILNNIDLSVIKFILQKIN